MALDCSGCYYIVVNHYGRFATAFAETDLDRANYETTIADLMSGQHSDPLRVIMFNPNTDRAEDVSHAIAQEILRRLGLATCRQCWRTSLTATSAEITPLSNDGDYILFSPPPMERRSATCCG